LNKEIGKRSALSRAESLLLLACRCSIVLLPVRNLNGDRWGEELLEDELEGDRPCGEEKKTRAKGAGIYHAEELFTVCIHGMSLPMFV
jgi:hypothetical protein